MASLWNFIKLNRMYQSITSNGKRKELSDFGPLAQNQNLSSSLENPQIKGPWPIFVLAKIHKAFRPVF